LRQFHFPTAVHIQTGGGIYMQRNKGAPQPILYHPSQALRRANWNWGSAGLVWSGLLPGPENTYMCVMSVLRLHNVTPWLQSHWCA